jgi:hypothetical protein
MTEHETSSVAWDDVNKVPIVTHDGSLQFDPLAGESQSRHDISIGDEMVVKALLDRRPGDILIVSLHGAFDRNKYDLPRFERRASFRKVTMPVLYVADPSLDRGPTIGLSWYVGTENVDPTAHIAQIAERTRAGLGCAATLFVGSSGGGFAALQMAAQVPGSMALAFSPQVSVSRYWQSSQDRFMAALWPHIADQGATAIGRREDATLTYADGGRETYVWYVQNRFDEWHIKRHLTPFVEATGLPPAGGEANDGRWLLKWHDGRKGHGPPERGEFLEFVEEAVVWLRAQVAD